jgi:RNA polymerase sigma factor (sigma-70 family)
MIQDLFDSGLIEAYEGSFGARFTEIDKEDIRDIIATSTDELFRRICAGEDIRNIKTYLWKIIEKTLIEFDKKRKRTKRLTGNTFDIKDTLPESEDVKGRRADQREKMITLVEDMLPRLGQTNAHEVIKYLLGAIRNGVQDITSTQIADALGLTSENVRTSMHRGFKRLARILRDEGLIDEQDDFPFLEGIESFLEVEIYDSSDTNNDE